MEIEAQLGSVVGNHENGERINDGVLGAYLVWEEVTVVIPNMGNGPTKRLLNGLTGYAQPGRIMAIMGPSGSGKSTLLHSLAGRLPRNVVMKGSVVFNGRKRRVDYGTLAYVTQEDVLLGTLTVKETIRYSAELRVASRDEVNSLVERTIIEMGLEDCADRFVGNWHLRGISGGEKKRLSIALEILTSPTLLLLDEPTTGLDSASAFFVVQALRNVSADGTTVISSIHQPSSEVFALFDDLFLLSGGETVYFGEAKMALQFFAESGYSCPSRRNPSDHFLRCINSDFDQVNATLQGSHRLRDLNKSAEDVVVETKSATEIKAILVDKYRHSKLALTAKERIREISSTEWILMGRKRESGITWSKQLWALTRRSSVNMSRDIGYYWLRIVVYTILSICVGTVFFDIGTSYNSVIARGACGGFVSGFMTIMSIGGFPSFIEEMKVFSKERLNGHYGVGVFILSNFLSSFPFLALMSFSTATITYYMVKFHPGLLHLLYANIDLLGSIAVVESCMMVVASLVPNFLMGIIVGAGFIGIMMMTAGFFRFIPDLPKLFWTYPMSYINYMAWALQGAYKNDMIGMEFDSNEGFKVKGEVLLQTILGISVKHSKWWDLVVVFAILIFYRLLFFTILKLKETALPAFHKMYVKRTLEQINKRASFRKALPSPFPSKRHLHPLSSQEGLFSPLHN